MRQAMQRLRPILWMQATQAGCDLRGAGCGAGLARTVGDAQVVEAAGVVRVVAARRLERLERSLPVALTVAPDALLPVRGCRVIRVVARVRVVVRV